MSFWHYDVFHTKPAPSAGSVIVANVPLTLPQSRMSNDIPDVGEKLSVNETSSVPLSATAPLTRRRPRLTKEACPIFFRGFGQRNGRELRIAPSHFRAFWKIHELQGLSARHTR